MMVTPMNSWGCALIQVFYVIPSASANYSVLMISVHRLIATRQLDKKYGYLYLIQVILRQKFCSLNDNDQKSTFGRWNVLISWICPLSIFIGLIIINGSNVEHQLCYCHIGILWGRTNASLYVYCTICIQLTSCLLHYVVFKRVKILNATVL